ncbi:ADP-forming succinate--CoA ligase subunit beta [Deltaproteobacteria bacterium]|nr:ADP-forming succinate--CoA ligase subunit beta [Deltaproteobacteria bacterium]
MKLHEYQAKDIFRKFGIPVPDGELALSSHEAEAVIEKLKGPPWVVKAQVHAGGRGKGGGVRIAGSPEEVINAVNAMLGAPLVTKQTGPEGKKVNQTLIEEGVEIDRELYLAMVIDRVAARPVMIFSQSGGMDIEEVSEKSPELVLKELIDPAVGWAPYHGRNLVYGLDILPVSETIKELMSVMACLYRVFMELDCSLAEINPIVITKEGNVLALDAKIDIDDNALFRQKGMLELDDPREKDPLEKRAAKYNLNYIRLDGNIGAMVNGAGLAMATMDVIKMAGAEPANFLDVGGGASEEMIENGFEIILEDKKVKAILINIFGGILRCDVLARGVLAAARKRDIKVPLIVRLEGTNVEEGRKILEESDLKFMVAGDMAEAAELVKQQVAE